MRIRGLTYREGDHTLKVGVEPLRGDAGWAIYLDTFRQWEPPFAQEIVTWDEIFRIRQNIVRALDTMNVQYFATGLTGTIPM